MTTRAHSDASLRQEALAVHGRVLNDQMRKRHGTGQPPLHIALYVARCAAYIVAGQHIAPSEGPQVPRDSEARILQHYGEGGR